MNTLIIYPSWEERSLLGFEKNIATFVFDRLVLFTNANPVNSDKIDLINKQIVRKCDEEKLKYEILNLDFDSSSFWGVLKDLAVSFNKDDKVTIDISTMSRNLIWALLFFLREKVPNVNVIYYQPHRYSNDWLSHDAGLPRLLFKHSGIVSIDKQTLLVIVTGFDLERTKQLVYFYNPSKVILLVQKQNRLDDSNRNTFELHAYGCRKMGVRAEVEAIDCYGDDWGYNLIERVISDNVSKYNIIVSSLGPKLSAISVYRSYLNHPEIALTYIPCKEYNLNYCEGIGEGFEREIIF